MSTLKIHFRNQSNLSITGDNAKEVFERLSNMMVENKYRTAQINFHNRIVTILIEDLLILDYSEEGTDEPAAT